MFAYCLNNPVCRKDVFGTYSVAIFDDNYDPTDDDKDIAGGKMGDGYGTPGKGAGSGYNGGSGSGTNGSTAGYEYSTPPGGGGTTSLLQVGNTTVTFGHGGRHMDFSDISGLESTIANDVVTRPPTTGGSLPTLISYGGVDFTYRYFTLSDTRINVGTYFYTHIK